jgi:hypothetical protein
VSKLPFEFHALSFASALPPGVRRGLCPPLTAPKTTGYALGMGSAPMFFGRRPNEGHSPNASKPCRRGVAFAAHPAA